MTPEPHHRRVRDFYQVPIGGKRISPIHIFRPTGVSSNPEGEAKAENPRNNQSRNFAQSDDDGAAAASISHQNTNTTLT